MLWALEAVTEKDRIKLERRIDAPPEVVYAYFTESSRWARWQGLSANIQPVRGGALRMTMGNGLVAEGTFLELVPHRRVRFTWGWQGSATLPPGSSSVTIDLVPDGDGTSLTLTHEGLSGEERAVHQAGWRHYLGRLTAAAEGRDLGPDQARKGG